MADIGIDFDAINRKEKRMEKPKLAATSPVSTTTMGKAIGSGSGIGRAGAGALRPPPNQMMGSGMGMGMGMGTGHTWFKDAVSIINSESPKTYRSRCIGLVSADTQLKMKKLKKKKEILYKL